MKKFNYCDMMDIDSVLDLDDFNKKFFAQQNEKSVLEYFTNPTANSHNFTEKIQTLPMNNNTTKHIEIINNDFPCNNKEGGAFINKFSISTYLSRMINKMLNKQQLKKVF